MKSSPSIAIVCRHRVVPMNDPPTRLQWPTQEKKKMVVPTVAAMGGSSEDDGRVAASASNTAGLLILSTLFHSVSSNAGNLQCHTAAAAILMPSSGACHPGDSTRGRRAATFGSHQRFDTAAACHPFSRVQLGYYEHRRGHRQARGYQRCFRWVTRWLTWLDPFWSMILMGRPGGNYTVSCVLGNGSLGRPS
jgi:hypothetical protein